MSDEVEPVPPPMRRVPPRRFYELPHFHIYLDDLIAIERAFRAIDGRGFKITADSYEFDQASDLPHLGTSEIADIKFHLDEPYADFESREFQARVYSSDTDDLRLTGLAATIREIVEQRPARKGKRWVVSLGRSTDPRPTGPATWREENRELVAAIVGAIVGALAFGAVTVILVATGVLKAA